MNPDFINTWDIAHLRYYAEVWQFLTKKNIESIYYATGVWYMQGDMSYEKIYMFACNSLGIMF